jgi:hypothetical protein
MTFRRYVLLQEELQNTLYHGTDMHSAVNILKNKKFILSPLLGSSEENLRGKKGRLYFFSTARTPVASFMVRREVDDKPVSRAGTPVIFNLNRDILKNKYSIRPVDYWQMGPTAKEGEDRIFSPFPTIDFDKNASRLIRCLHILFQIKNTDKMTDSQSVSYYDEKRRVGKILSFCQDLGIGCFVYADEKDYILQNTKNALPDIENFMDSNLKNIKQYMNILLKKEWQDLTDSEQSLIRNIKSYPDTRQGIEADLHNCKKPSFGCREILDRLLMIWRKNKINNISDYMQFVLKKWDKDLQKYY